MLRKSSARVYDKTKRVSELAGYLLALLPDGGQIGAEIGDLWKACALAKADLVTEMVFEFTGTARCDGRDLRGKRWGAGQGREGGGRRHYWPVTAEGKLPRRISAPFYP